MGYDLIIKNGLLVDGTGNPGYQADLAVKDDKIAKIATSIDEQAKKIIDANGMLVTPGFIDPHVHEELVVLNSGEFTDFLKQGVTTLVNGNCGHSVTPGNSDNIFEYMYKNGLVSERAKEYYAENKWSSLTEYIELVKEKGFNLNMGILLGHGTIRWSVMGGSKDRKPTEEETKQIASIIEEGLSQGALGMSTGLSYIPSRYADTEELIAAAKVLAKNDSTYSSHIRYYEGHLEAVKEAIEIGKKADVRVQVSHLTPTATEAYQAILEARRAGVEVAVDTIPKSSGHCTRKDRMLQFIMALSSDLFEKGIEGVKEALRDPKGREKILEEAKLFDDDKSNIYVINTEDENLEGKSITEIAELLDKNPDDVLLDMLADDNLDFTLWLGGINREDFPGDEYPEAVVNNPLVMVGSDRIFGEVEDAAAWYELFRRGAFPIFFKLMQDKGVAIEDIIRRLTSLPAQQFRLTDRGILKDGMAADIAIIDLDNYSYPDNDSIDYRQPITYAKGVQYVVVNGQLVLEDSKVNRNYPGKFIGKYGQEL
ncbi:MAG TPA: amidohydrolase family protein [Halanaerobiales bacterium]|nr:amidohydrolase family protein [Halanaerobiales bacterium]